MAEDHEYEFEAPQFVDFQNCDDEHVDTWFDETAGEPPTAASNEALMEAESDFEAATATGGAAPALPIASTLTPPTDSAEPMVAFAAPVADEPACAAVESEQFEPVCVYTADATVGTDADADADAMAAEAAAAALGAASMEPPVALDATGAVDEPVVDGDAAAEDVVALMTVEQQGAPTAELDATNLSAVHATELSPTVCRGLKRASPEPAEAEPAPKRPCREAAMIARQSISSILSGGSTAAAPASAAGRAGRPATAPAHPSRIAKPRLTVPVTPAFARRKAAAASAQQRPLSSEEQALAEVAAARARAHARLERNRRIATAGAAAVLAAPRAYRPARSAKPLTEPTEFAFRSDARLRSRQAANTSDEAASQKAAATKDKPSGPRGLTVPVTPAFVRAHPAKSGPKPKTSEELELEAIAAHPRFRARPVSARVLESNGELGVPKVPKAKPTLAAEPKLAAASRVAARKAAREAEQSSAAADTSAVFRARAVPRSVYEAPAAVSQPVTSARPLTVPASPALSTKTRAAIRLTVQPPPTPVAEPFKAQPLPVFETPVLPRKVARAPTQPQPFALAVDERGERYHQRLNESISSQLADEAQAHQFRAHPLPDLSVPDALPRVSAKPPTKPEPFALASVARHDEAAARFKAQVDEEMAAIEEQFSAFHARPFVPPAPFVPAKSTKALTEITEFALNTSVRSERRASLSETKAAEQARLDAERAAQDALRAEQEAAELREYRRSLDFKAHGVKHFKPVEPTPSNLPLTEPRSPALRTKARSAARV